MKNDNLNNEEKPFSFNDLDLGLDFDLSFLDDIDESVLEEEKPEKKPAAPKEAPVKKAPAEQKAPAAKKPAAAQKTAPAKKPASAQNTAPTKKPASAQNAATKKAAPAQSPANKAPARKQPVPQEEPVKNTKKKKKGPRLGGVIFYTLYFMFILIFFVATYIGLQWLQSWLSDFEQAQPTVKAEQVFTQLFTDPNWGDLYVSAGAPDSAYEGKEEYVAYMEEKVGSSALTYEETSSGLSKDTKKYVVRLDSEKVATFTLVDQNKTSAPSLENLENITDIPDWQLGAVEVFFEREGSYLIEKLDGHTAYVNDVALDDSFTIQVATTLAENYLPEGTTGFSMCTQQVTGLMAMPTVTVFDKDGNEMEVTYDEETRTFTERTESNTMSDEEKEVALEAAKVKCKWMIEALSDRGTVAQYYDASSDAYSEIVKATELWVQNYSSYEFLDESVTSYARYSDDIFSVRVTLTLKVVRTDGSAKDWPFAMSMFFKKNDSGNWLCFEATNVDVSQPVGRVRLTFMDGNTEVHSEFYSTDASEIITPILPAREGQVFTGWVTISEDEDGTTIYNLEFQPDETGKVSIPDGTTLKPMTLYTLFQNEDDVQEVTVVDVPAQTEAEETTPIETVAETTVSEETAAPETTEGA